MKSSASEPGVNGLMFVEFMFLEVRASYTYVKTQTQ